MQSAHNKMSQAAHKGAHFNRAGKTYDTLELLNVEDRLTLATTMRRLPALGDLSWTIYGKRLSATIPPRRKHGHQDQQNMGSSP